MKIHFVCTGNAYRSRMAEAYLKSKKLPNVEVSSSGIEAEGTWAGTLALYTMTTMKKHHLESYLSKNWHQTTKDLLEDQDLVIFMSKHHEDFCLNKLKSRIKHFETWNIHDIPRTLFVERDEAEINRIAEETFQKIKIKIDGLISSINFY